MRREGTGGARKAPKQSQIARVLVVDRLLLRTNQGGIEQENEANSLPAARGYGDPRRPKASCRENSSKSTFSYRTPVQQVGCVAKTHRDAEPCVIASSTHPTGLRPSPAGARPGSTPPLNEGDPPR